ncbi:uncharacterized protein LOC143367866 [Andrena cerasifolii]|uniref:uncharacterized protein LOC143367866 n=1 Tax=Andrena cerasifolii TaxID=2819439 RepID=UPI004038373D
MGVDETSVRRILGDGLSLKLPLNEQLLEVRGDGCDVVVAKNCGNVRIIGDGCRLRIDQNLGDVEYTGDGGQVLLGRKSSRSKVKYVGDGGRVSFDGHSRNGKAGKLEQASKKIGKTSEGPAGGEHRSCGAEAVETASSDKKEAEFGTGQEKAARTKVATVVTRLHCNEELVSRWFVNPGSVVRSFNGAPFVKIAPRKVKVEAK